MRALLDARLIQADSTGLYTTYTAALGCGGRAIVRVAVCELENPGFVHCIQNPSRHSVLSDGPEG